jgi:hypothetical protein
MMQGHPLPDTRWEKSAFLRVPSFLISQHGSCASTFEVAHREVDGRRDAGW